MCFRVLKMFHISGIGLLDLRSRHDCGVGRSDLRILILREKIKINSILYSLPKTERRSEPQREIERTPPTPDCGFGSCPRTWGDPLLQELWLTAAPRICGRVTGWDWRHIGVVIVNRTPSCLKCSADETCAGRTCPGWLGFRGNRSTCTGRLGFVSTKRRLADLAAKLDSQVAGALHMVP